MSPQEFLEKIVPAGLIVVAKLNGRAFRHTVCETFVQAANTALQLDRGGEDCYFALGALKEKRVYNEVKEKWEVRVGKNIRALKSFFIDFDVDASDASKYGNQAEAIIACKAFCKATNFPSPMIVSSGGGLHVYWPLSEEIDADTWRIHASKFKNGLITFGIKFDPSRTGDASSVLRVLGTNNYKTDTPRPVALIKDCPVYSTRLILEAIDKLPQGDLVTRQKPKLDIPGAPGNLALLGTNTDFKPQEPANFKNIMLNCKQMGTIAAAGGDVPQPYWYNALGIVRFCEHPEKVAKFISSKYPGYTASETQAKLDQWAAFDGPVTCSKLEDANPGGCAGCPHKGKITTPLQLGRQTQEAEPPTVAMQNAEGETIEIKIPNPPWPYTRRASGGIVVRSKSDEGVENAPVIVHDYDMYPVRRIFSERQSVEMTVWRVKQPLTGWQDVLIEQAALADARSLHAALMSKGIYVPTSRLKLMVGFMIAYITELQKQTVVEKTFAKMAWQEDLKSFVLDTKEYHTDGRVTTHTLAPEIKQELPGLHSKGTLEGWKETIQFYNNPGYEAHRMLLYASFGSPIFHMTGHKGAILSATGKPGAGKSSTLQAICSVWGHPQQLIINGTAAGTTQNARTTLLSTYNNLPFPYDEITKQEPRAVGEMCLAVSQGTGKKRSTRSGQLSALAESWSLIMVCTANTDLYVTLAGDRRDATAEAMRALQIPVSLPLTHTKAEADHFINVALQEHYGHAGHVYAQYIATNYAAVKKAVLDVTNMVDTKGKIQSGERFWSAIISSCIAGAFIARQLGLLKDFPIESDCKWIINQIKTVRGNLREQVSSPKEILSEFLEKHISETLAVSLLGNPNIAPKVTVVPRGALTIRHETENGIAYIVRTSLRMYCNAIGANFTDMQDTLIREGVLLDSNAQKVLGAGTEFGKGQSRCWKVDLRGLE